MIIETSLGYGASRALDSILTKGKKPPKALDGVSVRQSFVVLTLDGKDLEGALETVETATKYLKEFAADMGEAVTVEEKKAVQGARDLITSFGTLPRMIRAHYPKPEASEQQPETHSTTGDESANTVSSQSSDNETENEDNGETSNQTELNLEGFDEDSN